MSYDYWNKRTNNILNKKPDIDDISLSFYKGFPLWFNKLVARIKDKTLMKLLKHIHPIDKLSVLDIGCGSGRYVKILSDLGANVTGIDISRSIIERCKHKFPNITFFNSSLQKFDQELYKFDLILSSTTLQHIPDNEKKVAFKKISRLLKDSGSLLIIENQLDHSEHIQGLSAKNWANLGKEAGLVPRIIIPSDHRHLIILTFKVINIIDYFLSLKFLNLHKKTESKNIYSNQSFKGLAFLSVLRVSVFFSYFFEPIFQRLLPISLARHVGILFEKKSDPESQV
tara:strand:- start:1134 stop:1985 length:852 start_codon:yes stop_codon:yes gene_type:complete